MELTNYLHVDYHDLSLAIADMVGRPVDIQSHEEWRNDSSFYYGVGDDYAEDSNAEAFQKFVDNPPPPSESKYSWDLPAEPSYPGLCVLLWALQERGVIPADVTSIYVDVCW